MFSRRLRWGLIITGALGLLAYWRFIASGGNAMSVTPLGPPHFLYISPGEARFMLLHALVAVPSLLAVTVGLSDRLSRALEARLDRYVSYDRKQFRTAAVAYGLILFALYRIGQSVVMHDLAITDDTNAVEFGARILAAGHFSVPQLAPEGAFLDLFLYTKDGQVSSADWPGPLLIRALSLESGLGGYLYALLAAVGGTAVVVTAHRLLGPRSGLLAALVFLVSPLALGISLTSHAHVGSRAFIAVAIWIYVEITLTDHKGPSWHAVALGLVAGAAFLTRPVESAALLGPAGLHLCVQSARRRPNAVRTTAGALGGFAVMLGVFGYCNFQTTGDALLPARFDFAHAQWNTLPSFSLDERLSLHVSHNLMLLSVYMLGALALPLALLGALAGKRPLGVIALGVAASFGLMLAHENVGIHTIGPIHYTDAAAPLSLLFVAGVDWVVRRFDGAAAGRIRATAFSYVVFGVGLLFTVPWLGQLQRHGEFVARPHEFLASKGVSNAIVISPQLAAMRRVEDTGSWQLNMPHPDPLLRADIAFALPQADPDALHRAHPSRNIYRLTVEPRTGELGLVHVHQPSQ